MVVAYGRDKWQRVAAEHGGATYAALLDLSGTKNLLVFGHKVLHLVGRPGDKCIKSPQECSLHMFANP